MYLICLHVLTSSYEQWKQSRIGVLQALVIHANVMPLSSTTTYAIRKTDNLPSIIVDFEKYKVVVRFYCLIELIYKHMFADESLMPYVPTEKIGGASRSSLPPSSSASTEGWDNKPMAHAEALQAYLRQNSNAAVNAAEKVLNEFENYVLPAETIDEAFDCVGALGNDRFIDADTVSRIVEMAVNAIKEDK